MPSRWTLWSAWTDALPESVREYAEGPVGIAVLAVAGLLVLFILYKVVGGMFGGGRGAVAAGSLKINLAELKPPAGTPGPHRLSVEGLPVRLVQVVLAPAGKDNPVDAREMEGLLDGVVRGLGAAGTAVEGGGETTLTQLRRPDADERSVVARDVAQAGDDAVEQLLDGECVHHGVAARRGDDDQPQPHRQVVAGQVWIARRRHRQRAAGQVEVQLVVRARGHLAAPEQPFEATHQQHQHRDAKQGEDGEDEPPAAAVEEVADTLGEVVGQRRQFGFQFIHWQ